MTPAAAGDIDCGRPPSGCGRLGHRWARARCCASSSRPRRRWWSCLASEPGARLLDVGAGDGNLALAAVRQGAEVEACDLAAAMVERGRARAGAVRWREADVQALPYPSGRFDAVASTFGAVLAPRALTAARELARVTRPGGTVALAAWVPRGLPGRLGELVESVQPLPHGVPRPAGWGVDEVAQTARLSPARRARDPNAHPAAALRLRRGGVRGSPAFPPAVPRTADRPAALLRPDARVLQQPPARGGDRRPLPGRTGSPSERADRYLTPLVGLC